MIFYDNKHILFIFACMKGSFLNIILSVTFLLAGQSVVMNNVMAQEPDPDFFIFLGIGQSNMQGKGPIEREDYISSKSFTDDDWARYKKMIIVNSNKSKIGTWEVAKPPIVRPDTYLGVTDYFGRYLVKGLDERYKIGVVVVAVDGCQIEAFSKDKNVVSKYLSNSSTGSWVTGAAAQYDNYPYGKLVEMAKKAQQSGVIKGIIFHQGESGANDGSWLKDVYTLYTNLLSDLNLSDDSIPFIAGEPLRMYKGNPAPASGARQYIDMIPDYFKKQSGKDIAYVASSEGLSYNDEYHFSSEGYRILGRRYGEIMLPILLKQGAVANTVMTIGQDEGMVIYDLLGRRLATPQKGINIINGKKVIVK